MYNLYRLKAKRDCARELLHMRRSMIFRRIYVSPGSRSNAARRRRKSVVKEAGQLTLF